MKEHFLKRIFDFLFSIPGRIPWSPRRRWDFENMKTDHQDFRIPNELVLGKKLKMKPYKMGYSNDTLAYRKKVKDIY